MELVQIFLPLRDNQGKDFPFRKFEEIKEHLVKKFGGVTAFLNSPGKVCGGNLLRTSSKTTLSHSK